MTSDEKDPAWWDEVTALGWAGMDHDEQRTVERYGRWCVLSSFLRLACHNASSSGIPSFSMLLFNRTAWVSWVPIARRSRSFLAVVCSTGMMAQRVWFFGVRKVQTIIDPLQPVQDFCFIGLERDPRSAIAVHSPGPCHVLSAGIFVYCSCTRSRTAASDFISQLASQPAILVHLCCIPYLSLHRAHDFL